MSLPGLRRQEREIDEDEDDVDRSKERTGVCVYPNIDSIYVRCDTIIRNTATTLTNRYFVLEYIPLSVQLGVVLCWALPHFRIMAMKLKPNVTSI